MSDGKPEKNKQLLIKNVNTKYNTKYLLSVPSSRRFQVRFGFFQQVLSESLNVYPEKPEPRHGGHTEREQMLIGPVQFTPESLCVLVGELPVFRGEVPENFTEFMDFFVEV